MQIFPVCQARDIYPMLFQCWPTVFDAGPALKQHRVNAPCLLGRAILTIFLNYLLIIHINQIVV